MTHKSRIKWFIRSLPFAESDNESDGNDGAEIAARNRANDHSLFMENLLKSMFLSRARLARYQAEQKSRKTVGISADANIPEANKELNERPELATSKLFIIDFSILRVAFLVFASECT